MGIAITSDVLDGCVLSLLTTQDYYGYALTQRVQASLTVSESTMYPVLRRLKKMNWVTTYDQPYAGRNRRYYTLTDAGRAQLRLLRRQWLHYKQNVDALMGDSTDDIS